MTGDVYVRKAVTLLHCCENVPSGCLLGFVSPSYSVALLQWDLSRTVYQIKMTKIDGDSVPSLSMSGGTLG